MPGNTTQRNLPEYSFDNELVTVPRSWKSDWTVVVNLCLHIGSAWLYTVLFEEITAPRHWRNHIYTLLLLSFAAALFAHLWAYSKRALAAKSFQAIIHLVLAVPNDKILILNAVLLCLYTWDLEVIMTWKPLVVFQLVYMGLLFLMVQLPIPLWQGNTNIALPYEKTLLFVWGMVALAGTLVLSQWRSTRRNMENRIQHLISAVSFLSNANRYYQEYAETAATQSIKIERLRISREIHDTVGYTMVNLLMVMEAAKVDNLDRGALRLLLDQGSEQVKNGLLEMRTVMRGLRNMELPEIGMKNRFLQLARIFESATGVSVQFHFGNARDSFGKEIDDIIYRMLQEGFTNSIRHGHATEIAVYFWVRNGSLLDLSIVDDGSGTASVVSGIGIDGMRERLKLVDGTLTTTSNAVGFTLKATIPLGKKPNEQTIITTAFSNLAGTNGAKP